MKLLPKLLLGPVCLLVAACSTVPTRTDPLLAEFWIDLIAGEEVAHAAVIDDLAGVDVIFVGETHSIARHHALQRWLLQELFTRGVPLVLCLEQLEARDQPALDRYLRGELDFATLAQEIDWAQKWNNYPAYRGLIEFARQHRIPVRGLNAPHEIIRAVNRGGGLANLPAEQRAALPAEIVTDDPAYARLLDLQLAVHMAVDPTKLRPLFEAQVSRDEAMAEAIVAARHFDDTTRCAFVVLGAGHIRFGLGTPDRVHRREPGIRSRIVLATESGQLRLTPAQEAGRRDVEISHADLRALGRPPGDYVRILPLATVEALPPGHPPIAH